MELKELPNNLKAEAALLANIFIKNDLAAETIGTLKPEDFYSTSHKMIYEKLIELYKKNIPIDIITFTNSISKETLESIGGFSYLSNIIGSEATTVHFKEYLKIVKDLSSRRILIKSCQAALESALKEGAETKDIIFRLEENFIQMDTVETNKTIDITQLMRQTLDMIESNYKNGGKITGISTGYKPIDNATNGFVKGDLMLIAARPSMGKTLLALNMLSRLSKENKAALFELEMTEEKLGVRLIAAKTLLNAKALGRGKIQEPDFALLVRKCGEFSMKDNLYINCKSKMTTGEIAAEAKKIKIKHGLDIIFIDHLGKIKPDNLRSTRNDQVGQISQDLKSIAKDLDVCVVALCQLNRSTETRGDKHPTLSDLRDSGNLEQDADEILMLYRDDYYAKSENRESKKPGILEILVAKNRDGEVGLVELAYDLKKQIITEKSSFQEVS